MQKQGIFEPFLGDFLPFLRGFYVCFWGDFCRVWGCGVGAFWVGRRLSGWVVFD